MLLRKQKIRLHDNGTPMRNWLHASDTAEAVIKIIEQGQVNEIYNVAGGFEQKNIHTVEKIIKSYFNVSLEESMDISNYIDLSFIRQGQDVRYALNDNKLRSLGWEPKKIFDNEIQSIVSYYKDNFSW